MANAIQAGKYTAKIVNYGIGQTKAGDPQVLVLFEYDDVDGQPHEITYYGSLKEKAQEYTLNALLNMGMVGNDVASIAGGVEGGVLDVDTPVSIVIALEPNPNDGKTYPKVKWVNRLGGTAFQKAMSKDEAKLKLGTLNLQAAMMERRQATGIKDEVRSPTKRAVGQSFNDTNAADDDLPF